MKRNDLFIDELIKMRGTKKGDLLAWINFLNESCDKNWDLANYWGRKYAIVDLWDYWRIIKMWGIEYLTGFVEWYLYNKEND